MTDVGLRAATAAAAVRVAAIMLESRRTLLPFAPSAHPDAEVRAWVRDALIPGGNVTVAVIDAQPAGVLAVARNADARWITQLYVDPHFVGKGVGAILLAHALAPPIRLYTFQRNARARRFYERHGFKAIGFTDASANEERCPDVLYELAAVPQSASFGDDRCTPGRSR